MTLLIACIETQVERLPAAPRVAIEAPEEGARPRQGESPTRFEGRVHDEWDAPPELALQWVLDEGSPVQATADDAGGVTLDLDLDALERGPHAMALRATDTDGETATAVRSFEVQGPAGSPEVTITRPSDGASFREGDAITLQGTASDATTPADDLVFTWSSDLDGELAGAVSGDGATVLVTDTLGLGSHAITLSASDTDGEWGSDTVTLMVVAGEPEPADAGDLVFSEMLVNPEVVPDEVGEWIELYNTSGAAIDVDGYLLRDDDVDAWTLEGPLVVQPGDWAVLCADVDRAVNGGVPCDGGFLRDSLGNGLALANGADELVLETPEGAEIDALRYDETWFSAGVATGVDPDFAEYGANDDGANWCDQSSVVSSGGEPGTPGRRNDGC